MTKGCYRKKSGIFYNHLVIFNHIQESNDQFIILNGDDPVQILLDIREDFGTGRLNSSTICNSIYMRKGNHFPFLKRCFHASCTGRLYTNHFDMGIQKLCKCGNSCSKSAASNRHKNVIYQRKFLYDLHSNGSLTCSYCQIIKGMDKSISFFFCQFQCKCTGFIIYIPMKDHLCPIAFGTLYLDQGCGGWHDDDCFYPIFMCCIGNTLSMVSCRSSDQPFASLFFRQCTDLIISTTHLICSCTLHIFRFKINLISSHF